MNSTLDDKGTKMAEVNGTGAPAPARRKGPQVLDHDFDGIREFDNPTPGWWHALFILTVVFSVLYIAWYSLSPVALSLEQQWERAQVAEYKKIFGAIGNLKGDQETILKLRSDGKLMQVASGMFQSNCAACHAKDGGGVNGVNLTDDAFKNVKKVEDLFTIINVGAGGAAMPAWKDRLTENERVLLAAYVANLRGTKPAVAKAPEGEVIPPWPTGK
jgi:cytochrome c oxidase cbb3-type subunit 3